MENLILLLEILDTYEEEFIVIIYLIKRGYIYKSKLPLFLTYQNEHQWRNIFKMNRSVFDHLLRTIIAQSPMVKETRFARAFAVFTYYTSRYVTYRDLAEQFGLCTHTCREDVILVTKLLLNLKEKYLYLPKQE